MKNAADCINSPLTKILLYNSRR